MEGNPAVTVIIPTYKRPRLVGRAIESVLKQTIKDLELLVIDDCSQDETRAIVEAIGDPRVRYVKHDTNKGLPAVRNTGIRLARGQYIAFLDDDDEWCPDKLERQLAVIPGHDAVACAAIANGVTVRIHRRPTITSDDLRRGSFAPSSLLVKADVLRTVLFDETITQGEDWDALIRLVQHHSIAWVPAPLLLYNEGTHARMTNEAKLLFGAALERRTAVLHKHRRFFGERWFRYHIADTYLSYIGSRSNKLRCILYAVERSDVRAVASVLFDKLCRKLRQMFELARFGLQQRRAPALLSREYTQH